MNQSFLMVDSNEIDSKVAAAFLLFPAEVEVEVNSLQGSKIKIGLNRHYLLLMRTISKAFKIPNTLLIYNHHDH